jgi:hypothetical protein
MNKLLLLVAGLAMCTMTFAQAPAGFKYQAVARDGSGAILSSNSVSFRISILQGNDAGPVVYSERHFTTTNEFGLVNLEIGKGAADTGTFDAIGWGASAHFVQVEMDPSGGSSFQLLGSSQLMSVPYALHAKTVETGDWWGGQVVAADATLEGNGTPGNPLTVARQGALTGQALKWNGASWMPSVDETGDPLWMKSGTDLFYNDGKVGIGRVPGADTRQFQSVTGDNQAIAANNNSAGWPAFFAENIGGGLAAEFRSPVKIADGTQGEGKVLTSSTNGLASWQAPATSPWLLNGSHVYYNAGNAGIGTDTPDSKLTIHGGAGNADVHLINTLTGLNETNGFRMGTHGDGVYLWNYENSDLTLATNNAVRVRVKGNGNVEMMENLWLPQGKKLGLGVYSPRDPLELMNGSATYARFFHTSSGMDYSDGLLIGIMQSDNRSYLWNYENGPIYFGTNNTSAMAILANGNVGIGSSSPGYKLDVEGAANLNKDITSGQALLVNGAEALWYNSTYFSWGYGSTYNYFARGVCIGTTTNPGTNLLVVNGAAAKPGGGSWATWSDIRLKNLHGNYEKGLNEIAALQPVKFTYREGNPCNLPSDQDYVGFVAQEVQKVFPEAVSAGKDGYLNFDMHPVNVALVNSVKELKAENDKLRAENERLKAGQAQISARLGKIENYLKAEAKK